MVGVAAWACDVTNNVRYLGRNLGLFQELQIKLKPLEMLEMKNTS